ncbi:hypothetical protein QQF64_022566 [Cirrhinus molitorella]|uniref:Uncharacterized protein n=1 Tax=Cirrhinus molitorella TaxID=172907 RepID=A0ABR3L2Q3_9TELE
MQLTGILKLTGPLCGSREPIRKMFGNTSQAMNGRRARETDSTRDSHTHREGREVVRLFWQTECVCDGVSMALALAAVCEV